MPVAHPVVSAISPEGWARAAQTIMRRRYWGVTILAALLVRFE